MLCSFRNKTGLSTWFSRGSTLTHSSRMSSPCQGVYRIPTLKATERFLEAQSISFLPTWTGTRTPWSRRDSCLPWDSSGFLPLGAVFCRLWACSHTRPLSTLAQKLFSLGKRTQCSSNLNRTDLLCTQKICRSPTVFRALRVSSPEQVKCSTVLIK